jgi:hypothetical protein
MINQQEIMMKLQTTQFALACALAALILWVICSLFVMLMPMGMMSMSGYMMHGEFSTLQWQLGMHSFFLGLIAWTITAGVFGWLIAAIYNKLC